MNKLIDTYEEEKICEFKGEKYSVRNNGAVLRHPKNELKPRPYDNYWTFGVINKNRDYLYISGVAIHRIIAYAFLGEPKDSSYVVDHIDTNKRNNRVENLRWVTRFENLFLNEITRKKIELLCNCSAEDIMKDITILQRIELPQNYSWMRTVSKEEAAVSLERWKKWVKEAKRRNDYEFNILKYLMQKKSDYKMEGNYPYEPTGINPTVEEYANKLVIGCPFFEKEYYGEMTQFTVTDFYYDKEKDILTVASRTKEGIKKNYLTTVIRKNDKFIYDVNSYFDPNSIDKYMTLAKGLEWTGGDVFDDYC